MSDAAASQLRRLLQLIPRLADGEEHSVDEVVALAGADRETLLRDLQSLSLRYGESGGFVSGVDIYMEHGSVVLTTGHFKRPMRLTAPELCALELGLGILRTERPPDEHRALDGARERLRSALALLPSRLLQEELRQVALGETGDTSTFTLLRTGVRENRKVRLRYRRADASDSTDRTVEPYGMIVARGAWYLVAYCDASRAVRIFRLDRVEGVELLQDSFAPPESFDIGEVVRDGRVFHAEEPQNLRVRYSPRVARWIAEREGLRCDPDGTLVVDHPLADASWAVRHVLQYGADAEVLEPPSVREEIARRLKAALS